MKKGTLILLVLCLVVSIAVGAAKPPKYWRDLLQIKPTTEWTELYGHGDESWLAYNAWIMKQLLDGQGEVISSMKKKMDELKARVDKLESIVLVFPDPNDVE